MKRHTIVLLISLFDLSVCLAAQRTYDIRSYGAKCDGVTQDTVAIQKAIGAANAADGGIVTGPKATTCAINPGVSINLLANVTVQGFKVAPPAGQSMSVSVFQTNNGSDRCPKSLIQNVNVYDMNIDGASNRVVPAASGLTLKCVTNSRVERNTISNIGWEGVNFVYSTDSDANKNLFFSVWGDCADAQGKGGHGILFDGNTCDAQGHPVDGGLSANVESVNTTITNNIIKVGVPQGVMTASFGIEVAGGNNVVIDHNVIEPSADSAGFNYGPAGNGIRVYKNVGADAWDVTISNNIIAAPPPGGYCIDILAPNASHQDEPIKILSNHCGGSTSLSDGGFYLNGYAIEVANNTIDIPNARGHCIKIDTNDTNPSKNLFLHDNDLIGCGIGIFGPMNGSASNIRLKKNARQNVKTYTNAIPGAITSRE